MWIVTGWNGSVWLRLSTGMNERVKAPYVFGPIYMPGRAPTAGGRHESCCKMDKRSVVTVKTG
jgi:hypothetical protein